MSDPQGDGPPPPTQQPELDAETFTSPGGTAPKRAPAPLADDDEGGGDGPPPPTQQP